MSKLRNDGVQMNISKDISTKIWNRKIFERETGF